MSIRHSNFTVLPAWLVWGVVLTLASLSFSCEEDKNHLEPYSPPLTAKQKGEQAMKNAANESDDAQLLAYFGEARTQLEQALLDEPDEADAIYPLLATALAGLAGLAFYKVLLDGISTGDVNPESLATNVLPTDPTQAQIDLMNGAVERLRQMSAASVDTGIQFQTTFYSMLAIRMTTLLIQNSSSSIADISPENADAILNNLDAIIETGLSEEQKEQFAAIKAELDELGGENATSAEKLAAYCTANPTSEICASSSSGDSSSAS